MAISGILLQDGTGDVQLQDGAGIVLLQFSGYTYGLSLSASVTPSATLRRADAKVVSASVTPAGAVRKADSKSVAAGVTWVTFSATRRNQTTRGTTAESITPTGTVRKSVAKVLAGSVNAAGGGVIKAVARLVAATVMLSSAFLRAAANNITATLTPAGSLKKDATKAPFTGTVTLSGSVVRVVAKGLTATVTLTAGLIRAAAKTVTATVTPTATLAQSMSRPIDGTVTPAGVARKQATKAPFAGTVTLSSAIENVRTVIRFLSGGATLAGGLVKATDRVTGGSITLIMTFFRRAVGKRLTGEVTPESTRQWSVSKIMKYTITLTRKLVKAANKAPFAGVVTPSGADRQNPNKWLGGSVTPAGTERQAVGQRVSGTATPSSSVRKDVGKRRRLDDDGFVLSSVIRNAVAKTLSGVESLVGAVRKAVGPAAAAGSVTPGGLLARQPTKRPRGSAGFAVVVRFAVEQTLVGSVVVMTSVKKNGAVTFERSVPLSATRTAAVSRLVAAAVTLARHLTRASAKSWSRTVAPAGAARRATNRMVIAEVELAGTEENVAGRVRAFSAAVDLTAAAVRSMTNRLERATALLGRVRKGVARAAESSAAPAGELRRSAGKVVASPVSAASYLVQAAGKLLAGAASLPGTLRRAAAKAVAGSVTPAGEVNRNANRPLSFAGAVALAGTVGRAAGKAAGGSVSLAAAVGRDLVARLRGLITLVGSYVIQLDGPSFEGTDGGPVYRTKELRVMRQDTWTILRLWRTAEKIVWKVLRRILWPTREPRIFRPGVESIVWRSNMATPEAGVDTRYMTTKESKTFGFDFKDEGIVRQGAVLSDPVVVIDQYPGNTSQVPVAANPAIITSTNGFIDSDGSRIPQGKGAKCRVTPTQAGKFKIAMRVTATLGSDVDTLEANGILVVSATIG